MRIRFEEIKLKATRKWIDANGKKRQETKVFMQTLNPYNVDEQGQPKSRFQIERELMQERSDWLGTPPTGGKGQ